MNFGSQEMKGKISEVRNGTLLLCTGSESVQMFRSFNDMQVIGTVWPTTMATALGTPSNINGKWMVPIILEGLAELESFQPAPAQPPREDLLDAVFKACDVTQDGILTANEMYRFARCLDFPGSDKDWDKEFSRLCTRWGEESNIGLREDAFLRCMNDPESYYFCSDTQLSSMLMMLPNGLTRVGLVTDIFRTCDQNGDGKLSEAELLRFARALGFPGTDKDWAREFRTLCTEFGDGDLTSVDMCTFRRVVNRRDGDYYCTETQLSSIKSAVSWDLSLSSIAPRTRMRDHSPAMRPLTPRQVRAPISGPRTEAAALCRCGAIIPPQETTCLQCGCDRPVNVIDCRQCSLVLPVNVAYCPKCGAAQKDQTSTETSPLVGGPLVDESSAVPLAKASVKTPRGIAALFGRSPRGKADDKSTSPAPTAVLPKSESPAPSPSQGPSASTQGVVQENPVKAKSAARSASPRGIAGFFGRKKKVNDKSTSPAPATADAKSESPAPVSSQVPPESSQNAPIPSTSQVPPASFPNSTNDIDDGPFEHTLRITMVSAVGLRRGDWICFCEGMPDSTGLRIKTPSKSSTAKPIWDFSGEQALTHRVDSLMFVVFDSFLTSEESRFVAMLDRSHIYPSGFETDMMKLEGRNNNATLSIKVEIVAASKQPALKQDEEQQQQQQQPSPEATEKKAVAKKRGLFKLFGAKKNNQQPADEQAVQADTNE